ncbi:DUF3267 domain-containing protein [Chitinophaga horti]|uniref:DUF3267 domain-containing protein n=1 Tax=Chitinophaga horti TaxID=2920382 RepID=A0ABY6J109_9BACT|nr:DUF3267 domain-containing protein [Chitinophaga horti]UYQ93364.1 DUF3267 domain-containing protein [Chitinophaga horti]
MGTPERVHEELRSQGYALADSFSFREMLQPVREGFGANNAFVRAFKLITILFFLITTASVARCLVLKQLSFWAAVGYVVLGVLLTAVLIPLHEWIHGLAFKYYGAKDVRYGVIWRYLVFYAVAHLQVLGARQYYRIGLAPFVAISLTGLMVIPWCAPAWQLALMGTLCFHTLCCVGDFGLCAYFLKHVDSEPLTFDDAVAGRSYIYLKKSAES